MILLDYSSVAMASVMVRLKEFEDNHELVRHQIFNTIRMYNAQFRDEFGEMVICFDYGSNWRRDKFPEYKASRRKNRKESDTDWNSIYEVLNQVREEVINNTPYKCVRVENCEADDVIGAICEMNNTPQPILIISPDKDFVQLQRYPNVKQYSNIQKKWVEPDEDPVTDLEVKVLRGDSGDGVPNVLSDDDALISESKRQSPLSKKKIAALMEDPEALGTAVARRIIRNRDMIDLRRTPKEYKEEAMKQLTEPAKGNMMKLMTIFTKHRMKMLAESLQDFEVK